MADFDLHVNDKAFERLGVKPVVDENLYGQLIDEGIKEGVSEVPNLDVMVTPNVFWGNYTLRERWDNLRSGDAFLPVGGYQAGSSSITLPAHPNAARTNKLLIHETGHFIDHLNGDSIESAVTTQRRLKGAVALAGAGVVLGLAKGNRKLVVASALSPIATLPTAYWNAPHEKAARQFAESEDARNRYSKIITYRQV